MRWLRTGVTLAIIVTTSIGVVSDAVSAATPPMPTGTAPAKFVAINSTRILDTRPESRVNYLGDKPAAGSQTVVNVIGRAGVPADASAITGNVTATDATAPGYVQAFPTGVGLPGTSSNLNVEQAGQTIANAVTVPIGVDGAITLFTQSGTHLVLDITGYFVHRPSHRRRKDASCQ